MGTSAELDIAARVTQEGGMSRSARGAARTSNAPSEWCHHRALRCEACGAEGCGQADCIAHAFDAVREDDQLTLICRGCQAERSEPARLRGVTG